MRERKPHQGSTDDAELAARWAHAKDVERRIGRAAELDERWQRAYAAGDDAELEAVRAERAADRRAETWA
jgi:hypothetical protein